jgi:hypothetical protein
VIVAVVMACVDTTEPGTYPFGAQAIKTS